MTTLLALARYAWASPYTGAGVLLGLAMVLFGGSARLRQGVLEFAGGGVCRLLARWRIPFGAITFGHVVLGLDHRLLDELRAHEQVHVRQYERWGPLFVPAYLLSSLWQWMRGGRPYLDNRFEREAYACSE